jgi:hypothetical protein
MFTFIELNPFAAVRDKYLSDDEFAALQLYLMEHPWSPIPAVAGSFGGQSEDEANVAAYE